MPGIGSKTAVSLLQEYGTLDNLLESKHLIKQKKVRKTCAVMRSRGAQPKAGTNLLQGAHYFSYRGNVLTENLKEKALRNLFPRSGSLILLWKVYLSTLKEEDEIFAEPSLAVIAGRGRFLRLLARLRENCCCCFLFDIEPLTFVRKAEWFILCPVRDGRFLY